MANPLNLKYNALNALVSNGSSSDLLFTTALAIFAGGSMTGTENKADEAYALAVEFLDVSKEMFNV